MSLKLFKGPIADIKNYEVQLHQFIRSPIFTSLIENTTFQKWRCLGDTDLTLFCLFLVLLKFALVLAERLDGIPLISTDLASKQGHVIYEWRNGIFLLTQMKSRLFKHNIHGLIPDVNLLCHGQATWLWSFAQMWHVWDMHCADVNWRESLGVKALAQHIKCFPPHLEVADTLIIVKVFHYLIPLILSETSLWTEVAAIIPTQLQQLLKSFFSALWYVFVDFQR